MPASDHDLAREHAFWRALANGTVRDEWRLPALGPLLAHAGNGTLRVRGGGGR